jgi:DNA polymerase I
MAVAKQSFGEWVEEGEHIDETDITGFDFVRSDVATVTQELQQRLLHLLLSESTGEAIDTFSDELRDTITDIENGEYPIDKLGKSAGISQSLAEYGSVDRKAQPQYRGAKYANRVIYETDAIGEGDRPLWFYVERVRGLPRTYDTETAEDGCYVDSIAVLDASDLPSGITIDTEKMIRKTLEKPLAPILRTLGYEFDELRADTDQSDISAFM